MLYLLRMYKRKDLNKKDHPIYARFEHPLNKGRVSAHCTTKAH